MATENPIIPKDLMGQIKQRYRDASNSVRRSLYGVGRQVPVYREGSAPFYASSSRSRARMYEGFKHIFKTRTRAGAGGTYRALENVMRNRPNDVVRLQRLAHGIGRAAEKGKDTSALLKRAYETMGPTHVGTFITSKKGRAATMAAGVRGAPPAVGIATSRGTMRTFLAGTAEKGIFKAYQHAVFNPRNLAIAGTAYLGARATGQFMKWGENYFTENVGRGKFGRDTAGQLGPASLKGMRFQTMTRRRVI